jgi:hypothetical protein
LQRFEGRGHHSRRPPGLERQPVGLAAGHLSRR